MNWIAVIALCVGGASTLLASERSMDFFGVGDPLYRYPTSGFPTTDYTAEIKSMAAAGVKWTRFGPTWGNIQPASGAGGYNATVLADLDNIVAQCNTAGINIIFYLNSDTPWASMRPDLGWPGLASYRPLLWSDWDAFVNTMVTRYNGSSGHGRISYWEVWNEPDYTNWLDVATNLGNSAAIADFAELLRRAAIQIHTVPGNAVLLGGLAGQGSSYGSPGYGPGTFLDQLLSVPGAVSNFDILSYHSYGDPTAHLARYNGMMTVLNNHGAGSKRIWITESGFSTSGQSSLALYKLNYPDEDYLLFRSPPFTSNVDRVIYFNYRDQNISCNAQENNFGLLDSNLVQHPSFYNFQSAGIRAPTAGFIGPAPDAEGAESNFLLQKTYPNETPSNLTLYYIPATSGNGSYVTDYDTAGSQKQIPADTYMYFNVNDDWLYNGNDDLDSTVYVDITYLDVGTGNFALHYDATTGSYTSILVPRTNTGNWLTTTLTLNNVRFGNNEQYGADMRLYSGGTWLAVSRVGVRRIFNPGRAVLQTNDRSKLVLHVVDTNPYGQAYNPVVTYGTPALECRQIPDNTTYMYFKVSKVLARSGNPNVTIGVTFWDDGGDPITLEYNSVSGGALKAAAPITKTNTPTTGTWRSANVVLYDASFSNGQSYNADFRLSSGGASPQYIRKVAVLVTSPTNF